MELLNQLEFIEGLEWNLMFPVFSLVVILLSYLMLLKDVLDQKLKTTIRQEEQMDIQEKIFSSPGRPIGILNLPLEERLRRDREALKASFRRMKSFFQKFRIKVSTLFLNEFLRAQSVNELHAGQKSNFVVCALRSDFTFAFVYFKQS